MKPWNLRPSIFIYAKKRGILLLREKKNLNIHTTVKINMYI